MARWLAPMLVALSGPMGCSEAATPQDAPPQEQPPDGEETGCKPGEATLEDGGCQPAGIPEGACGEGFESDGTGSCHAVLPSRACGAGQMATPGETACREVSPCGEDAWGAMAADGETQFVDGAYGGSDSDGSKERPWTTIQQGVAAAPPGGLVAVAAGSYEEDLELSGSAVVIRGRCASMVEIVGSSTAIRVGAGAGGSELHDLAVRGSGAGISVAGVEEVLIERVWVHDTAGRGLHVLGTLGATSVTVRGSLIEGAHRFGIRGSEATLTVESSVVRGTQPDSEPYGLGIWADARAQLTLRSSVIEDSVAVGVFLEDVTASIETSVIRETQRDPVGSVGRGLELHSSKPIGERLPFSLKSSLVERSHGIGVVVAAADATFEGLVVRDTVDDDDEKHGRAFEAHDIDDAPARVTLLRSVMESNHDGINTIASETTVDRCLVRDNLPNVDGVTGRGMTAQVSSSGLVRGLLTVRDSVVERNHELGVMVWGADLRFEHSVARGTRPVDSEVESGIGLSFYRHVDTGNRAGGVVSDSWIEDNTSAGLLLYSSDLLMDRSVIRDTRASADGLRGRGLHAQYDHVLDIEPATLTVRQSSIERSAEFGVVLNAATAVLEDTVVRGVTTNAKKEFGDGILVVGMDEVNGASLQLTRSRVEGAARAGVATFGGTTRALESVFECNAFDLHGEAFFGLDFSVRDDGGNTCGCSGEAWACQVLSSMLQPPPAPLGP